MLKHQKTTIEDVEYKAASAFLGDFSRIHFGGQWELCLDQKENSLLYGYTVITGLSPVSGVLYPPFMVLSGFLADAYPENSLLESILYEINPEPLNLDDLPTEEERTSA